MAASATCGNPLRPHRRGSTRGAGRGVGLTRSSFRLWFCVGVAFIAAAIADPIVEFAANARWFGPGRFTDHSNLDVLPALLAGTLLLFLYIGLRVRSEIAGPQWPRTLIRGCDEAFGSAFVGLVPLAYCLQILVLYVWRVASKLRLRSSRRRSTLAGRSNRHEPLNSRSRMRARRDDRHWNRQGTSSNDLARSACHSDVDTASGTTSISAIRRSPEVVFVRAPLPHCSRRRRTRAPAPSLTTPFLFVARTARVARVRAQTSGGVCSALLERGFRPWHG